MQVIINVELSNKAAYNGWSSSIRESRVDQFHCTEPSLVENNWQEKPTTIEKPRNLWINALLSNKPADDEWWWSMWPDKRRTVGARATSSLFLNASIIFEKIEGCVSGGRGKNRPCQTSTVCTPCRRFCILFFPHEFLFQFVRRLWGSFEYSLYDEFFVPVFMDDNWSFHRFDCALSTHTVNKLRMKKKNSISKYPLSAFECSIVFQGIWKAPMQNNGNNFLWLHIWITWVYCTS